MYNIIIFHQDPDPFFLYQQDPDPDPSNIEPDPQHCPSPLAYSRGGGKKIAAHYARRLYHYFPPPGPTFFLPTPLDLPPSLQSRGGVIPLLPPPYYAHGLRADNNLPPY